MFPIRPSDAALLFAPPQPDAWGSSRPPYAPPLMRLAAELSAATYAFDFSRFLAGGWMDVTLQVENRLFPQIDAGYAGQSPREFLRSGVQLHRAKSMLAPALTDVLRAMRQLVATDTGKAVVMACPLPDDRVAVAVSFMGTGRKFYDWFTNLKLSCHGGVHDGFLSTARLFDRSCDRIAFPRTAQRLGLRTLTLADILAACTQRDARFRLFLCGHSQGGAVAQAYCRLLRDEHALCMENVVGYTLAAPLLVSADFPEAPAAYPLYHLINTDDFVPRMGAQMRLGVDMRFTPTPNFRAQYYGYSPQSDPIARMYLRRIGERVRAMPDALAFSVALLRVLCKLPDPADARAILRMINAQLTCVMPAMQSLGLRAGDLLPLAERPLLAAYRTLTGQNPDEARLLALQEALHAHIARFGAASFVHSFCEIAVAPHMLLPERGAKDAPYPAIASHYSTALTPCIHALGTDGRATLLAAKRRVLENIPENSCEKQETAALGGNIV